MASGTITKVMPDSGSGYIRFPDGTQICWKSMSFSNVAITRAWGSLYETTDPLNFGNWPIAFIEVPAVSIVPTGTAMTVESVRQTTATAIGNGHVYRATSGTYSPTFSIIGVGRWK